MRFPCVCADALPAAQQTAWQHLCQQLGLRTRALLPADGLYLQCDEQGLALAKQGHKGVVRVDFGGGAAHYRRLSGGGELLSRAVQPGKSAQVWDATAGLGRDAWVLANMGFTVCAFERHPVVYALLDDGLRRAREETELAEVAARIQLSFGSICALDTAAWAAPDVVYLDPMYPPKQKSAAVKKDMAYFHELLGQSDGTDEMLLLRTACVRATRRVVVKRPVHGAFLGGIPSAFQYRGKSVRFDVYLPTSTEDSLSLSTHPMA